MLNYVLNKKHDNRLPPVIILNYDATKQIFLDKCTGCLCSLVIIFILKDRKVNQVLASLWVYLL